MSALHSDRFIRHPLTDATPRRRQLQEQCPTYLAPEELARVRGVHLPPAARMALRGQAGDLEHSRPVPRTVSREKRIMAHSTKVAGARYDRGPAEYLARVTKAITDTMVRDDQADRCQSYVGAKAGAFRIAATDGRRALLLPGPPTSSEAKDATAVVGRRPDAVVELPADLHGALKRVRTCAPKGGHVQLTVSTTEDGRGAIVLATEDPHEGCSATEVVWLPNPPEATGVVQLPARHVDEALGVWPLRFHYDPAEPVDADAPTQAVVFAPVDEAWRYVVMPISVGSASDRRTAITQALERFHQATARLGVPVPASELDTAPTEIRETTRRQPGPTRVTTPASQAKSVLIGNVPTMLWVARTTAAQLDAVLATRPDARARVDAARLETPAYVVIDAARLSAEDAEAFDALLAEVTPATRARALRERWARHRTAVGIRAVA